MYINGGGEIHLEQGCLYFTNSQTGSLVCKDGEKRNHFIIDSSKNNIFKAMKSTEISIFLDVIENKPYGIIKALKDAYFCQVSFQEKEWRLEPKSIVAFNFKQYDKVKVSEITEKLNKKQHLQWELEEMFREADSLNNKILEKLKEITACT